MEFIYLKCVFIPTCLNFSHLQSTFSLFGAIHLSRCLFYHSEQVLNSLILMPFSASAIFCFASSPSAKHFPLRTFFIRGKQTNKNGCSGQSGWRGRVGRRGHAIFGQKRLHTQCSVGRCTSPIMRWVARWKSLPKTHFTTPPTDTLRQMGS